MTDEGNENRVIGAGEDPYQDIPEMETVIVHGVKWVFQHITGGQLKRIQRQCRNPSTREIDGDRYLKELCGVVVLGRPDGQGNPIPGTKFDPDAAKDVVVNAMDAAITSFLGYRG